MAVADEADDREQSGGPSVPPARVVSVTPLPIDRDSRTLKEAASIDRLGYRSAVAESRPSGLARAKLPFELVTLPRPGSGPTHRGLARVLSLLRRVPGPPGRIASHLLAHGIETAAALPAAELYCLHGFVKYPGVALACRRHGARFVYDAHDFYPPDREADAGRSITDRVMHRYFLAVERRCVRRAAAAITTSAGNAGLIEKTFGRRPVVVLNSHDARLDERPPALIRERLGLDADVFLAVVSGNAGKPGMAMEEVVEALAQLPERVHLALIGTRYESLQDRIAEHGLEHRVHILGPVRPTEYAPFLAGADVAVIPYFPFSDAYRHIVANRFFVPLAAGVPVLYPEGLSDQAALAAEHDVGIAIDPRRPESIVGAIERLLAGGDLLDRYKANAARAAVVLSWEAEEERLARVLEAALERR